MQQPQQQQQVSQQDLANKKAGEQYKNQNFFEAIELYGQAQSLDQKNAGKYKLNKVACYLESGQYQEGLTEIREIELLYEKNNSGKYAQLNEVQLKRLKQRKQKCEHFLKMQGDMDEEVQFFKKQFFKQTKNQEDKNFLELLDDLETQETEQQKQENIVQENNQNNDNNNEKQYSYKNRVFNTVRGNLYNKYEWEFFPDSHSRILSLIRDNQSYQENLYSDVKDRQSFRFLLVGAVDIRIMVKTCSDFILKNKKKNSQRKLNPEIQEVKNIEFEFNEIHMQTLARNFFMVSLIGELSNQLKDCSQNNNRGEIFEKYCQCLYGFWFSQNLFQEWYEILVGHLENLIFILQKDIQTCEKLLKEKYHICLEQDQNIQHKFLAEFQRWLQLYREKTFDICKFNEYFIHQANDYSCEFQDLIQGNIDPETYFDENYIIETKLLPPFLEEGDLTKQNNIEKFQQQFRTVIPNFSFIPYQHIYNQDEANNVKKHGILGCYTKDPSQYEQKDMGKNQILYRSNYMGYYINLETPPYLTPEDVEMEEGFYYSYYDKDLEEVRQYVLDVIFLLENSLLSFKFSHENYLQLLQRQEVKKGEEQYYSIFLNNVPDYTHIFNTLVQCFYLQNVKHIRHDVMLLPGAFDMKRDMEGSGAMSMMLMNMIEDYCKINANRNVKRYLWAMFRCINFQEVQDFTGFLIDESSKSDVLKCSYTQTVYNQWNQPDYFSMQEINGKKRQRFQQWIVDMFLECVLPPKRIFEEQVGDMQKMSPMSSPLQVLFFIQLMDIVLKLNRFPAHYIIDFLKGIVDTGKFTGKKVLQPGGLPLDPTSEKSQEEVQKIEEIQFLQLDLIMGLNLYNPSWLSYVCEQKLQVQKYLIQYSDLKLYKLYKHFQVQGCLGALLVKDKILKDNNQEFFYMYGQKQLLTNIEKYNQQHDIHMVSMVENHEKGFLINLDEQSYNNFVQDEYRVILFRIDIYRVIGDIVDIKQLNRV